MLQESFQKFISEKKLINKSDKLLLAVSGGVDSMVLFKLCLQSGYGFEVAHVNFKLRDADSNADETLVRKTCQDANIPFHTKSFHTLSYARENKISIQMAARELRYSYFEELLQQYQLSKIVTAHHADDSIETFFINLLRGTGIKGLTGIPVEHKKVIRPLLFAQKIEIENYAAEHKVMFHLDKSNLKDDYLRNHIRHHLMPALIKTSDKAFSQLLNSMYHLGNENLLLQELHTKSLEQITHIHPQGIEIKIPLLKAYKQHETMLFLYLKNYGFTYSQVQNMLEEKTQQAGSIFYSNTHRVLRNRTSLILSGNETEGENKETITIYDVHQKVEAPVGLVIRALNIDDAPYKNASSHEVYVDAAKIQFPLTFRKWKHGDMIIPLGMKHSKKISDILIDQKIDLLSKEKTYVLCNAEGEIIWLAGIRMSEIFKIHKHTAQVYHISMVVPASI